MKFLATKNFLVLTVLLLVASGLISIYFYSRSPAKTNRDVLYSFFVAGHTYGTPGVDNVGLHPPFRNILKSIRMNPNIEMGFLTGDIVWMSTIKNWDEVDSDLKSLDIPVYFAPGNHDVTDRELFTNRYGKQGKTYWHFERKGDLFIILDPNIANWNISGDQLGFLKKILGKPASYRNVFVFFHQLLWWDKDNKFKNVRINSSQGRADKINFWKDVEPLFHGLTNEVFMFAGDVGAFRNHLPMYYQYDNMHFIGSGMGGRINDNYIIVNVPNNTKHKVEIVLEWLNRGHQGSQNIEDFNP